MYSAGLQIHCPNQWLPSKPRQHDIFLMEYFVELQLKPNDLKCLNMCRLYLQAITLADVSSADGTYILSAAKQGIQLTGCNSSLDWPTQERPNKTAWEYQAYQLSHLETRGKLQTKLGEWVNYHCQQWDTYIDPETFSLYSKDNGKTHLYREENCNQVNKQSVVQYLSNDSTLNHTSTFHSSSNDTR